MLFIMNIVFSLLPGLIGFLYRLTIWQTDIADVSAYYDECGSGLAASCLWTCGFAQYYNPFTQQCQSCESLRVDMDAVLGELAINACI